MSDDDNDNQSVGLTPILEQPEIVDLPDANTDLFPQSLPRVASRLSVNESALKLLVRDLKYNDFVRELLMTMMRVMKCEAGSILEVDHAKKVIFFRAAAGRASDQVVHFVIPITQGVVGHVVESRQPFLVDNAEENKIHLRSISKSLGFQVKNMVALPLLIRGKVYGVLELLNKVGDEGFTQDDIDFLVECCEISARAIEVRLMLAFKLGGSTENAA